MTELQDGEYEELLSAALRGVPSSSSKFPFYDANIISRCMMTGIYLRLCCAHICMT